MKAAIYPGSFNPFHEGHADIVDKALKVFDKIIVCQMVNPEKEKEIFLGNHFSNSDNPEMVKFDSERVLFMSHAGLLVDAVSQFQVRAVVRGLRNGYDLQYEANLQYWNEDLGLTVPVIYFLTDRALTHISSTAIRALKKSKKV